MHHSSLSWEVTLWYFFSWNFKWFGQKKSIKVLNFRFLTAHVKLHQICTLICSFCWKYIKFQLKMYRFCLMTLKNYAKFEKKLSCCFKIDMRNLANFYKLKISDFIFKSEMVELNQNKNSKQADWPNAVWNFILP